MRSRISHASSRVVARIRLLRRHESGAAVVEFALVVPVLFMIVFAVIDFGRALWTQNVLVSAVREGARVGAVQQDTILAKTQAKVSTACYVGRILKGATACTTVGTAVYDTTNVATSYDKTTGLLTVTLSGSGYGYSTITPYASRWFGSLFYIRPSAVFRWEQSS